MHKVQATKGTTVITFLTTNGGLSSVSAASVLSRQISLTRLRSGETDLALIIEEVVGRPYVLLARAGDGDLALSTTGIKRMDNVNQVVSRYDK